jgi:hypothetical protein
VAVIHSIVEAVEPLIVYIVDRLSNWTLQQDFDDVFTTLGKVITG